MTTATKKRTTKAKAEPRVPDVLVGFVRDASGSMQDQTQATRDGFAAFVAEQAKLPGGRLSLIDFGSDLAVRCVGEPFETVDDVPYAATLGMTALYDAVGAMIEGTDAWIAAHPAEAVRPIIVVWTDGGENQSRRWNLARLNEVIADRIAKGWEFAFLGSGGSAWLEGQRSFAQHVHQDSMVMVQDSCAGTAASYAGLSATMTSTRATATPMAANNLAGNYANAMGADPSESSLPTIQSNPPVATSFGTYEDATSALAGDDDEG